MGVIEGIRGQAMVAVAVLLLLLTMAPAYSQQRPSETPASISGTGIGHPPTETVSPTQGRAMAERAALLQAISEAARKAGRPAPKNYAGIIRVGATVQGFRITRITPLPDGSVEIEVSVPSAGVTP